MIKSKASLPTKYGNFTIYCYETSDKKDHVALVNGQISGKTNVLVRVHSSCLTGDTFFSNRCDCGKQLEAAMKKIGGSTGVLLYLRQEGRGIGLLNKIKAYALQDKGLDTVEANEKLGFKADLRDFSLAAKILKDLKVKSVKLLTNNPDKIKSLEKHGVKVTGRVSLVVPFSKESKEYMETKEKKMGHLINK